MANTRDFSVTIKETSKELSALEKVKFKDTSDAVKLDEATNDGTIIIDPDFYLVLDVHNENSKNEKDYTKFLIVDKTGTKYVTGSKSFWRAFTDIYDDLAGEDIDWQIKVYKQDSKNYQGKQFMTCSIA